MNKKDSKKYGIPIYTQEQMDSMWQACVYLVCAAIFFSFALGYVCGHIDLSKIMGFLR